MIFDEQYMRLCSEKTLQANKEGFFLQFAETIKKNVGLEWIKKFGKLKTDKDRIRKIFQNEPIKSYVTDFLKNVQEIYRKKDPDMSQKRLQEATETLKSGDKKKSLALYSQSVLKAPKDSSLSLALLGRAKLLISLNEFSDALSDLQLSLKEKLPNNLKFEAFWMMVICYKALNEDNRAQVAFNLTEKLIAGNEKLLTIFHHSLKVKYEPNQKKQKENPTIKNRHSIFTQASNKISVQTSPDLGRHVVANDDIKTGETLVVEEPEVACLYPEKFGTHCHHCFDRFIAPIGCPDCVGVAFCSPTCRDAAISTYHKYECKFLDLLIGSGMSVLSLAALRTITQKSLTDNLKIYQNQNQEKIFKLCTNSNKRTAEDFLQRTLMAAFLLRCLQKSGYFGGETETVIPTDLEFQIGEIILHNLQVLQFNAHEIYETLYSKEIKIKNGRPAYIGVALYPTVALFNHECYPAVTRYFIGKKIVVTSLRPLTSGSLIAENYGPIFTHRNLIERQRSLSGRYWFNCKCRACLENWPTMNNSTDFIERVRCSNINCWHLTPIGNNQKCPKCNESQKQQTEKIKWCLQEYEKATKLIEEKKIENAINVLTEAINVFHKVSGPPHKATHLAEEALRACFCNFGNTCECLQKTEN